MMKNILLVFFILIGSLVLFPLIDLRAQSQTQSLSLDDQKVIYQLPYPGILPDNPLYFIKETRDSIKVFITRDNLKKADLYLNLADKHMAIALKMAEKGREKIAISELQKSEELFRNIPTLLINSKKQGVAPSNDMIIKLYQSNSKHQEIITEVMKKLTQTEIETFKNILLENEKARMEIGKIN